DPADRPEVYPDRHADVAQLVEHHLAKVRVAGSNPVVRSVARLRVDSDPREAVRRPSVKLAPTAEWPSGLGKGLQSPVHGFDSRLRLHQGSRSGDSATGDSAKRQDLSAEPEEWEYDAAVPQAATTWKLRIRWKQSTIYSCFISTRRKVSTLTVGQA